MSCWSHCCQPRCFGQLRTKRKLLCCRSCRRCALIIVAGAPLRAVGQHSALAHGAETTGRDSSICQDRAVENSSSCQRAGGGCANDAAIEWHHRATKESGASRPVDRAASGPGTYAHLGHVLGTQRLPMLVLDSKTVLKKSDALSARAAGILGMMTFGAAPVFVLHEDLSLDRAALEHFLSRHGKTQFLAYGFTSLVWSSLRECRGYDLSQGILLHSGGWKALADVAVTTAVFRAQISAATGLAKNLQFLRHGRTDRLVLLEGQDGLLYGPPFADVIVRDPLTLEEVSVGTPGVLQTLSALPTSYPGHSVLT